jgi:hypothetical protein
VLVNKLVIMNIIGNHLLKSVSMTQSVLSQNVELFFSQSQGRLLLLDRYKQLT